MSVTKESKFLEDTSVTSGMESRSSPDHEERASGSGSGSGSVLGGNARDRKSDSVPPADWVPSRISVTMEELEKLDAAALRDLWRDQEVYLDAFESRFRDQELKIRTLQQQDPVRRDQLLVMRLSTKEQEIQELSSQITELKAAQIPSPAQLKSSLVDPAINIIIQKLKQELEETKKKMQETQEELSAWKFTPDSATGKRLMSKCRQLLQENEDIGKMISSGRLAKLESELAMQKALCAEMKKNQEEMDDFVQELDLDIEGMQSTIYFLQQQLKEAKETIASYESGEKVPNKDNNEAELEMKETPVKEVAEDKLGDEVSTKKQEKVNVEEEQKNEDLDQAPMTRGRRGKASSPVTPIKENPRKGRSTRGQKREAENEDAIDPKAPKKSPGRPKRKRAASQKFNDDAKHQDVSSNE